MRIGEPDLVEERAIELVQGVAGGIRDAEVRVYNLIDALTNETKDTEIMRLYCDPASILADSDSIRP